MAHMQLQTLSHSFQNRAELKRGVNISDAVPDSPYCQQRISLLQLLLVWVFYLTKDIAEESIKNVS